MSKQITLLLLFFGVVNLKCMTQQQELRDDVQTNLTKILFRVDRDTNPEFQKIFVDHAQASVNRLRLEFPEDETLQQHDTTLDKLWAAVHTTGILPFERILQDKKLQGIEENISLETTQKEDLQERISTLYAWLHKATSKLNPKQPSNGIPRGRDGFCPTLNKLSELNELYANRFRTNMDQVWLLRFKKFTDDQTNSSLFSQYKQSVAMEKCLQLAMAHHFQTSD